MTSFTSLIIGGHLTPALALCDFARLQNPQAKLLFVGRLYSQHKLAQQAHEHQEVSKRGIPFIPFDSVKLDQGLHWWQKVFLPFGLGAAVVRAMWLLRRYQPSVVVSFGGYLAVPLAIAAWIMRIRLVTHEQTLVMGKANQLIARLATKVCVSFPETTHPTPTHKTVVTGNPLRRALFERQETPPSWAADIAWQSKAPLLYVTGGNQGSAFINELIEQLLPDLTTHWVVIHQCGNPTKTADYQARLQAKAKTLPADQQSRYYVQNWFSDQEVAWIFQQAKVVVARAGANTVWELVTASLPAVLIPLPFAHGDEQTKHAEWLAAKGGAIVLPQATATPAALSAALVNVEKEWRMRVDQLSMHAALPDADAKLWQVVSEVAADAS